MQNYYIIFIYANNFAKIFAFAADLALEMVGHKETWHYHLIMMALPGITLFGIPEVFGNFYGPFAAFYLGFNKVFINPFTLAFGIKQGYESIIILSFISV